MVVRAFHHENRKTETGAFKGHCKIEVKIGRGQQVYAVSHWDALSNCLCRWDKAQQVAVLGQVPGVPCEQGDLDVAYKS